MELFNMYVCHLGVVCKRCKHVFSPQELPKHLSAVNHRQHARISSKEDYAFMMAHCISTHGFMVEVAFDWLVELSEQVKGLDPPTLVYACPVDGCNVWLACNSFFYLSNNLP